MPQYSTRPQLPEDELAPLKSWLITTLGSDRLENPSSVPSIINDGRLCLYFQQRAHVITSGSWEITSHAIALPRASVRVGTNDRLAILAGIAVLSNLNANGEFITAYTDAFLRQVSEMMDSIRFGSIVSAQIPECLAVSQSGAKFALYLGGKWRDQAGIEVEVDETWTVMEL